MLDNTPNQPTKFRTKTWVEINDDSQQTYKNNSQIKFRIIMLKSRLCDYSDAYIVAKWAITVINSTAVNTYPNNRNKEVIFIYNASLNDCIREINKTQRNNAQDIDDQVQYF